MNDGKAGVASPTLTLLATGFAASGPVLALAPLGMAPLLIGTGLLATLAEGLSLPAAGRRSWPMPQWLVAALCGALLLWSGASLAWDIDPQGGARKLLDLTAVLGAALALAATANRVNEPQSRGLAWFLLSGVLAGLGLLAVETVFDFPLYRLVKGDDPRLTDLLESKRSVDSLPLLVWPAALALARLGRPWLGAALALGFAAASVRLTAASATLGMIASLGLLALAALSVTAARRLLQTATIAAFVLIIPAAFAAWDAGGTTATWLKRSGQHRVEIWHFAAGKALDRPFFGHGLNASRNIPNDGAVSQFLAPDKPLIPLHPHDAFLQVWLELGLVGVLISAALLLTLLHGVGKLPRGAQRFALAGYGAALVVAGLAFGIWQTWWLGTIAFSAAATGAIAADDSR